MAKIKKEEISKVRKLLNKFRYTSVFGNYKIFFPIEMTETKESNGIEFITKEKDDDVKAMAGLLVGEEDVYLSYADIRWAPKFDICFFADLIGCNDIGKKYLDYLSEFECILVKEPLLTIEI